MNELSEQDRQRMEAGNPNEPLLANGNPNPYWTNWNLAYTAACADRDNRIAELEMALSASKSTTRAFGTALKKERARIAELEAERDRLKAQLKESWPKKYARRLIKMWSKAAVERDRLRELVDAVQVREFSGIRCNDVNGKNWFDLRRSLATHESPADAPCPERKDSKIIKVPDDESGATSHEESCPRCGTKE